MRKWVICCGPDWYRPSVTSTKQLIRMFSENGYKVLWVNPIAFKSPFVNSSTRSSAWRKIKNKIATHLRLLRRDHPGFWVLVPFYLPSFGAGAEAFNRKLVSFQVSLCCLVLGIRERSAVLWLSGSFTGEPLLDQPFHRKVYQAADLISGFRDASSELKKRLQERERNLCRKADAVFAASETIGDKLVELCGDPDKVTVMHHGVDYRHFSSRPELAGIVREIRAKGRPVAGYFGSLSDANDKAVFLALADNGFSVVIIGKVLGDYDQVQAHEHIYLVGAVPYDELPSYAAGFDIGLLNWRMHEWIENCFPIKALEYLALGLPVVSCRIPVLMRHFPEQMSFINTPAEFVKEAERLVAEDNPTARKQRQETVATWSWEARFDFVCEHLKL